MSRRAFITLLGGAVTGPRDARAQQSAVPVIGFLGANAEAWRPRKDAFVNRSRELGWIDGRTVTIEYRWDDGRSALRPCFSISLETL